MIDFYEGWNLRNRLMQDGYLTSADDIDDGILMEQKIYNLVREKYNWEPAAPTNEPNPSEAYENYLERQTPTSRLCYIADIAADWDGFRTLRGVGGLIDEIIACIAPPCRSEHDVLEEVKLTKMFKDIPDFLNTRVTKDSLPFTWNFDESDIDAVFKWCREHDDEYVFSFGEGNRAANGEIIGYPITIQKGITDNDVV